MWGLSKSNWGPLVAGVQLPNPVALGEFETGESPELLEVRLTTTWGLVSTPVPFAEGVLQAEVLYGAGCANHNVTFDASLSTAILIPGGTINLSLRQVGLFSRPLTYVSVSIARYAGARIIPPTCSVVPAETAIVGPPALWQSTGLIPQRARSVIVFGRYSTGVHTLTFSSGTGGQIVNYDSGSDRLLMQTGCPIPVTAQNWTLTRPGVIPVVAREPLLSFLLD